MGEGMTEPAKAIMLHVATAQEFAWINARYDEVKFVHSDPAHDLVMIAEVGGEKAGLGRLVRVADDAAELGGMLVMEEFRGSGIAHRLVDALLLEATRYSRVYCLPFVHLQGFYRQHGFVDVADFSQVPQQVLEKHDWCNRFYTDRSTLLLQRTPASPAQADQPFD